MKYLRSINATMNIFFEKFLIVGFVAMTFVIFLQVVFRYFLAQSLSWSEEIARYLFVWLTFIGASVVAGTRLHIMVSSFVDNIKSKIVRKSLQTLAELLTIAFLYILIVEGFVVTTEILELGQISPSMPWLQLGWTYLAIPVGSLFMALHIVEHIYNIWTSEEQQKGGH